MFEEIEHTGEMAFRVYGYTLEDIVRYSVYALRAIYRGETARGKKGEDDEEGEVKNKEVEGENRKKEEVEMARLERKGETGKNNLEGKEDEGKRGEIFREKVVAEGFDFVDALISFLNELIYIFDAKKLVIYNIVDINVREDGKIIEGLIEFERFSPDIHNPELYVKAVARGGAELRKNEKGKFEIFFIVDI